MLPPYAEHPDDSRHTRIRNSVRGHALRRPGARLPGSQVWNTDTGLDIVVVQVRSKVISNALLETICL